MRHLTTAAVLLCTILAAAALGQPATVDAAKFIDPALPDCGIEKAIASLGAAGGTVVLPEGRFELLRSIMMPSNVTLQGQGPEKTILLSKRTNQWVKVMAAEGTKITVEKLPEGLKTGSTVFLWPNRPTTGWFGYYAPQVVTAIEGNILTVDGVKMRGIKMGGREAPWLEFGLASALTGDCLKGATELEVFDGSLFVQGQAISVGSGDGNANESLSFIKEIKGNTLILERAIRGDHKHADGGFWRRPAVWSLFPLITAENAKNMAVKDLGLDCPIAAEERPKLRRYTLSLIHIFNCQDSLIENVHAKNSFTDGISVQQGKNVTVRNCVVTGCSGNGFHPGTGLMDSTFEKNVSTSNGEGLYFCWHNRRLKILNNVLSENRGPGIGGLGNPGDHENLIEGNTIERNGGPGIACNGGKVTNNVIRNNIIRDNSFGNPGKSPGILIAGGGEGAKAFTIEGNTIESTLEQPTQWVGVQEQAGQDGKKVPMLADENIIKGNKFSGHTAADVIVQGPKTIVENNGEAKVTRIDPPAMPEPAADGAKKE